MIVLTKTKYIHRTILLYEFKFIVPQLGHENISSTILVQGSLWDMETFLVKPVKSFLITEMFEISYRTQIYDHKTGLFN